MAHPLIVGALLSASLLTGGSALAQQGWDNPRDGGTPCIVLNNYAVEPVLWADGRTTFRGEADIENLCGRAMEVSFCFLQAGGDDAYARSCYAGPVRPWASARVEEQEAGSRIAGAEYEWRYLD